MVQLDNLTELAKQLAQIQQNAESALDRIYPIYPFVEQARDTFDVKKAFELEFTSYNNSGLLEAPAVKNPSFVLMSLMFKPPAASICLRKTSGNPGDGGTGGGTGHIVPVCEFYMPATNTVLDTVYLYVPGTVKVYVDDVRTTNFTETGDTEITLGFTPGDSQVKVCYLYDIFEQIIPV